MTRIWTGAALLAVLAAAASLGPAVLPHGPNHPDFAHLLESPGLSHWCGTDALGRDMLARVLAGGRVSLTIAVAATAAATLAGVPLGLAGGLLGGWSERLIMRTIDAWQAIPAVLLALAINTALGTSVVHLGFAVAVSIAPGLARVAHQQGRALAARPFVAAARGYGAGAGAILWHCVLPNAMAPLLAQAASAFAAAMLTESALSFLGLGLPPPTPAWGGLVRDSIDFIELAWWLPWFPSIVLFLAVLGAVLVSDGLARALEPGERLR